jgi:hypothetical protein
MDKRGQMLHSANEGSGRKARGPCFCYIFSGVFMKKQFGSKTFLMTAICGGIIFSQTSLASQKDVEYCIAKNGTVETMIAEFETSDGIQHGFSKKFCTFNLDGGFIAVGLKTFSSEKQNIAASFIKILPKIEHDSPLWQGKYANPGINVCKNLGGSNIAFNVVSGGFKNKLGQSDVCVFGDGSMVSSWSLIYMANGRNEYNTVKEAIRSEPLKISY